MSENLVRECPKNIFYESFLHEKHFVRNVNARKTLFPNRFCTKNILSDALLHEKHHTRFCTKNPHGEASRMQSNGVYKAVTTLSSNALDIGHLRGSTQSRITLLKSG
jgi:hypothetical protein